MKGGRDGPDMSSPVARRDPFRFAHEHRDEIAWLSQNTNHLPTSPAVQEALVAAVKARDHEYYPFKEGLFGLPELARQDLGLDPSWQVQFTHGALEAVYVLTRALLREGDEMIATDPSFQPLHHQARLAGARVTEVPIWQAPWKLTVEQARAAITPRTKLLLLIDPINPLGTEYTRAEVKAFADLAREHGLVLLHDITYHDFAFQPTLAGEFYPEGTVYAVSYSKNCGFAGLRIGALIGQKPLMDRIRPYFVNTLGTNILAQAATKAALATKKDWIGRVVDTSRANQRLIADAVRKTDGCFIPVNPSSSNTLCIDVSARGLDPNLIEDRLLMEHKVFVRGGPYLSERFGARFVRVSFSVPPEHAVRFADAWPKVVNSL